MGSTSIMCKYMLLLMLAGCAGPQPSQRGSGRADESASSDGTSFKEAATPKVCDFGESCASQQCYFKLPRWQNSCRNDDDCAADERCQHGRCNVRFCTSGWKCPPHLFCDRQQHSDEHGCARRNCTHDPDCAGGVCVLSRCYAKDELCSQ